MSTVTASVVPDVRVTESDPLSSAPVGILTVVAPPSIVPFVTLTGTTIVNGAPVRTVALNPPSPAGTRETVIGKGSTALPSRYSPVSDDSPENTLSGRLLSSLSNR